MVQNSKVDRIGTRRRRKRNNDLVRRLRKEVSRLREEQHEKEHFSEQRQEFQDRVNNISSDSSSESDEVNFRPSSQSRKNYKNNIRYDSSIDNGRVDSEHGYDKRRRKRQRAKQENTEQRKVKQELEQLKQLMFDLREELREKEIPSRIDKEITEEKKEGLQHNVPPSPPSDRQNLRGKAKSKSDRMAQRSRHRRYRENKMKQEYEEYRRKKHLRLEEEAYGKRRRRKELREAAMEEKRQERLQELQIDYQKEWDDQLKRMQECSSGVPSRPSINKEIYHEKLSMERMRANADVLEQTGVIKIRLKDSFIQCEGENSQQKFVLRASLLPWGDTKLIQIDNNTNKNVSSSSRNLNNQVVEFQYRGMPPSRVIPAIRFELHKESNEPFAREKGRKKKLSLMVGAAEHYITKYLMEPQLEVETQLALSNGAGIFKLELVFNNPMRQNQPLGYSTREIYRDALEPTSRLSTCFEGTLRARALDGNLFNVPCKSPMNISVQFILYPWGNSISASTEQSADTGLTPRWRKHEGTVDLHYPGPPPEGLLPSLRVQVHSNHKLIGSTNISLATVMQYHYKTIDVRAEITYHGRPTGTIFLNLAFAPTIENTEQLRKTQKTKNKRPVSPLFIRREAGEQYELYNGSIGSGGSILGSNHSTVSLDTYINRRKPTEDELNVLDQIGTLKLRAIAGYNLRKVQRIGKQDPYLKVTLLPWKESSRCKCDANGGQNPRWSAGENEDEGMMILSYPGVPTNGLWPVLRIEVYDEETIMKDRLIGKVDYDLFNFLSKSKYSDSRSQEETIRSNIFDKKQQDCGEIVFSLDWCPGVSSSLNPYGETDAGISAKDSRDVISESIENLPPTEEQQKILEFKGILRFRAISGKDLKHVQTIGKQDPYVKVIMQPWGETTKCKTCANGGKQPIWSPEDGSMILSYPGAPPDGQWPFFNVQVFDAETIMKDRIIGEAQVPLFPFMERYYYFINSKAAEGGSKYQEYTFAVYLKDSSGKVAGSLEMGLNWDSVNIKQTNNLSESSDSLLNISKLQKKRLFCKGKLVLRILKATNLKVVQTIGKQDPYVSAIPPWNGGGKRYRTETKWGTGSNPQWDGESGIIEIDFPGWESLEREGLSHTSIIQLKVFDAEMVRKDREIGTGEFDFTKVFANDSNNFEQYVVHIKDKKGKSAGAVNFSASFILDQEELDQLKESSTELTLEQLRNTRKIAEVLKKRGELSIRVISAENLKVVQKIGTQDPYVKVNLSPWEVSGHCKTSWAGGKEPHWSKEQGLVKLPFGGATPEAKAMPCLKFEVMDDFKILKHRMIGEGMFDLGRYFTGEEIENSEALFDLPIKDLNGNSAGDLKFSLAFQPAEINPASPDSKVEELPIKKNSRIDISQSALVLHAQPIRAKNLKSVQFIGSQDPYVKISILKCGENASTKPHWKGGKNPRWNEKEHQSHIKLLAPANDHVVLIQVFDAAMLMKDKLIGSAEICIDDNIQKDANELEIELQDSNGKYAGTVYVELKYEIHEQWKREAWVNINLVQISNLVPNANESTQVYFELSLDGEEKRTLSTPLLEYANLDKDNVFTLFTQDGKLTTLRSKGLTLVIKSPEHDILGSTRVNLDKIPLWPASKVNEFQDQNPRWFPIDPHSVDKETLEKALLQMKIILIHEDDNILFEEAAATRIQSYYRGNAGRREYQNLRNSEGYLADLDSLAMNAISRAHKGNLRDGLAATNIQRIIRGRQCRSMLHFHHSVDAIMLIQAMFRQRKIKIRRTIKKGTLIVHVTRAWDLKDDNWIGKQDPYVKVTMEPGHVEKSTEACRDGGVSPSWDPETHKSKLSFEVGEHPLQGPTCGPIKLYVEILAKKSFKSDKIIGFTLVQEQLIELVRSSNILVENTMCCQLPVTDTRTGQDSGKLELIFTWKPKYVYTPKTKSEQKPFFGNHSVLEESSVERIRKEEALANEEAERLRIQSESSPQNELASEDARELEKRARAMRRLSVGKSYELSRYNDMSQEERKKVEESTILIQRVRRGSTTRRKLQKQKQEHERELNQATLHIQRVTRGKIARNSYSKYKKRNIEIRHAHLDDELQKRDAIVKIQRVYRGSVVRKNHVDMFAVDSTDIEDASSASGSSSEMSSSEGDFDDATSSSGVFESKMDLRDADMVRIRLVQGLQYHNCEQTSILLNNPYINVLLHPGLDTSTITKLDSSGFGDCTNAELRLPRGRAANEWPYLEVKLMSGTNVVSTSTQLMIASMKAGGKEIVETIEFYNEDESEIGTIRLAIAVELLRRNGLR